MKKASLDGASARQLSECSRCMDAAEIGIGVNDAKARNNILNTESLPFDPNLEGIARAGRRERSARERSPSAGVYFVRRLGGAERVR